MIGKLFKLATAAYAFYRRNPREVDAAAAWVEKRFQPKAPVIKPWAGQVIPGATYHYRDPHGREHTTLSHAEATAPGMEYVGYSL